MAHTTRTTAPNLVLSSLQDILRRQEEIGFKLVSIQAMTYQGVNFNQACFDDKIPNDGPYTKIVPNPAATANSAFIENVKTNVDLVLK